MRRIALPAAIVALIVCAALVLPALLPWSHDAIDWDHVRAPAGSPGHLLGTDELGRDRLARLRRGPWRLLNGSSRSSQAAFGRPPWCALCPVHGVVCVASCARPVQTLTRAPGPARPVGSHPNGQTVAKLQPPDKGGRRDAGM